MAMNPSGQRKWRSYLFILLLISITFVLFFMGLLALPALRQGVPPMQAIRRAVLTSDFLFIVITILFAVTVLGSIALKQFPPKKVPPMTGWMLIACGILMLINSIYELQSIISDTHYYHQRNQFFILSITFAIYGLFWILYGLTFVVPLQFWHKLYGDPEQRDERSHLIRQTAATTFYWTLGLLFIAGSLFNILSITSGPSARSAKCC